MSFMKPDTPTAAVPAMQAVEQANTALRPAQQPNKSMMPKRKNQTPSFLGQDAVPSAAQQGGKTLLGQ